MNHFRRKGGYQHRKQRQSQFYLAWDQGVANQSFPIVIMHAHLPLTEHPPDQEIVHLEPSSYPCRHRWSHYHPNQRSTYHNHDLEQHLLIGLYQNYWLDKHHVPSVLPSVSLRLQPFQ